MTKPAGLIRIPNGGFVELGNTKHVERYSFLRGGALPSGWVSSNALTGTGSPATVSAGVTQSATEDGYYRIGTGATSGETAALWGPTTSILPDRCAGIYFEVMGLRWSPTFALDLAANVQIGLSVLSGGEGGAFLQQGSAEPTALFRKRGVAGTVDTFYEMRSSGEASLPRRVGLLIVPRTKEIYLTEGGIENVIAWAPLSDMTLGNIRPYLSIISAEAVAKEFRFSAIELTTWQH